MLKKLDKLMKFIFKIYFKNIKPIENISVLLSWK